ncbi:TipAS antibiotic-recognition domain-containing protein [Streptomyces sp. NRRL WC-3742]|uniref:TipAS antibiotic-recognition domain-containing protein n=1 Tax=Streptomyces sp. NRRL WC-3742 TaxID=1463934 RepID=UPI0004C9CAE8|nr:TipAS antibiotic-recognition domain-containing protein [Streptomyces sp. NRRL WC-3742]
MSAAEMNSTAEEQEFSEEDQQAIMAAWQRTITGLIELASADAAPDDPRTIAVFADHYAWMATYWPVSHDDYVELGRFYAAYPDSRARFEAHRPGLAAFVTEAVECYARARSPR